MSVPSNAVVGLLVLNNKDCSVVYGTTLGISSESFNTVIEDCVRKALSNGTLKCGDNNVPPYVKQALDKLCHGNH